MPAYILFESQSMLLSATSRNHQPDSDLHPVQNPEHALVNDKQRMARYLQAYRLFIKFESMLLSASEDESKQNINLHSVYKQSKFLLTSS
jgi:hypothetical protein